MQHIELIINVFICVVLFPVMAVYLLRLLQKSNLRRIKTKLDEGDYIEGYVTDREVVTYSEGIISKTLKHEYYIEIDNHYRFRVNSLKKYNALPLHQKCKIITTDETIVYIEGYTKLEGRGMFEFLKE